jgi:hypothetical protein
VAWKLSMLELNDAAADLHVAVEELKWRIARRKS